MEINPRALITGSAIAFVLCCINFTSPNEGTKYVAYQDTGKVWSICEGHTENVHKGDVATPAQCKQYMNDDMMAAIAVVNKLTGNIPMPETTKKVFVDEVFNAGSGNFAKSTMLKKIKSGDIAGACRQFPRWHYVDGKDCTIRSNNCYGIVTRRALQMATCLKGLE